MKIKETVASVLRRAGQEMLNTYRDYAQLQKEKPTYLKHVTDIRTLQLVAQNMLIGNVACLAIAGINAALPSQGTFVKATEEIGTVLQASGLVREYQYTSVPARNNPRNDTPLSGAAL